MEEEPVELTVRVSEKLEEACVTDKQQNSCKSTASDTALVRQLLHDLKEGPVK